MSYLNALFQLLIGIVLIGLSAGAFIHGDTWHGSFGFVCSLVPFYFVYQEATRDRH